MNPKKELLWSLKDTLNFLNSCTRSSKTQTLNPKPQSLSPKSKPETPIPQP